MLASHLFGEAPPDTHGPRLSDTNVQGAGYGQPIPDFRAASPWLQGQIVWSSERRETRHKKETGGKGAPTSKAYWYTYDVDLCVKIAVGESGTTLRRIRANKEVLYDISTASGTVSPNWLDFEFYDGSETQLPDPTLEAALGVGNAPAFRGDVVIVFKNFQLNDNPNFNGQEPLLEFELVRSGSSTVDVTTIDLAPSSSANMGYQAYDDRTGLVFVSGSGDNSGNPAIYAIEPYSRSIVREYWLPAGYHQNRVYGLAVHNDGKWIAATTHHNVVIFDRDSGAVLRTRSTLRSGWVRRSRNYLWTQQSNASYPYWYIRVLSELGTDNGFVVGPPVGGWDNYGDGFFGTTPYDDVCYLSVDDGAGTYGLIRLVMGALGDTASYDYDVLELSAISSGAEDVVYDGINDCLWVVDDGATSHGPVLTQVDHNNWVVLGQWDWIDDFGYSGYSLGSVSGQPHMYFDAVTASIYLHFGNRSWVFNTIEKTLATKSDGATVAGSWSYYHRQTDTIISGANALYAKAIRQNVVDLGTETLASAVTYWCGQAGIPASSIDVSGLSGAVRTQLRGRPMAPAAMLRDLMLAYQFDVVLSDGKLKFVHRGGASAGTITRNDLAAHTPGESLPDELHETRAEETKLPAMITVSYWDKDADWEIGTQHGRRLVTDSLHKEHVQLSIGLTGEEAAQLADVLTYRAWSERMPAKISIPIKYSHHEPTDVLTIPTDDGNKEFTIEKMDRGANLVLRADITPLHRDLYTSYAEGSVIGGSGQVVKALGPTQFVPLDIPILRDRDDDAGAYAAAGWYTNNAPGCVINSSSDDGTTWGEIDSITEEAIIGSAITVLATGPTTVLDHGNNVTVRLMSESMEGLLASVSEASMLNGSNHFAFGAPGRWEILGAQNITVNSDNTITLDTLLRGRRGTEWTVGTHVAGDTIVYLNSSDLIRMDLNSSQIGVARVYRAVTIGTTLQDAFDVDFTNAAVGLMPYAPAHLSIKDAGGGDWDAVWHRRTRVGGEWRDYVDASLGESTELYRVKVFSGATELSTADVTSEAATVTASSGNTIQVAQVSSVVGAGYYSSITVP
jgi:hypothetical protein